VCAGLFILGIELAPENPVAKLMQIDGLLWLGKYSYAIYLWHYPMIIIAELAEWCDFKTQIFSALGMIMFILLFARLTWSLIESPVKKLPWTDKQTVCAAIVGTLLCLASLWVILQTPPDPFSFNPAPLGYNPNPAPLGGSESSVPTPNTLPEPTPDPGEFHLPFPEPTVHHHVPVPGEEFFDPFAPLQAGDLIISHGDSYASEWEEILPLLAKEYGWLVDQHIQVGCPWIRLRCYNVDLDSETNCHSLQSIAPMVERWHPKVIILHTFSILERLVRAYDDGDDWIPPMGEGWLELVEKKAMAMLEPVMDLPVKLVIVQPHKIPVNDTDLFVCASKHQSNPSVCDTPAYLPIGGKEIRAMMVRWAKMSDNFFTLNYDEFVCPNDFCQAVIGGAPQYLDHTHVHHAYARLIAKQWEQLYRDMQIF